MDRPRRDRTVGRTEPPRRRGGKCGNERARGDKTTLKVKLPETGDGTRSKRKGTREDRAAGRWTPEPAADTGGGGSHGAGTDSASVRGDVFFFSPRPISKATNGKKKAKLEVLRTISKMLKESRLIRQRLIALSDEAL